jgi:type IV secretion system protein VirB10
MRFAIVFLLSCGMLFAQEAVPRDDAEAAPGTVVVPAGTKLPVVLKHAINTKTAQPGDNIYCETNFPVVKDNRILIPAGTYVQGNITSVKRPGRVKGRAEVQMHFTTLIYPNGYTVSIPGALDQVPGAESTRVKDKEGTVQADSSKGKDVGTVASTGATGAVIGAAASGAKGAGIGAGIGGLAGLGITMLTRGNEVRLPAGTTVEMVLQRPLVLEEAKLSGRPREYFPSPQQERPLEKPRLTPAPDAK